MQHHTDGNLKRATDANNHWVELTNYYRGVPKNIRLPTNWSMSAEVNNLGWITSTTDPIGYKTTYQHDLMGRVNRVIYPQGDTAWDPMVITFTQSNVSDSAVGLTAGHWTQLTTQGNYRKKVYFDARWQPVVTLEEDIANGSTRRVVNRNFDYAGREVFASHPKANISIYSTSLPGVSTAYDALGRMTDTFASSEHDALHTMVTYLTGDKRQITDPDNRVTTTTFRSVGAPDESLPIAVALPEGINVNIARNAFGNPMQITRAGLFSPQGLSPTWVSESREYAYDVHQRLCKRVELQSGTTLFGYDPAGRLDFTIEGAASNTSSSACDPNNTGPRISRSYDEMGRVTEIDYPGDTVDLYYTYYADGALHTARTSLWKLSDPNSFIHWRYTYNSRRLLVKESATVPQSKYKVFEYEYNGLGHMSHMTYPNDLAVDYAPNALGQPTKVGDFASGAIYHPSGVLASLLYGNGVKRTVVEQLQRPTLKRITDRTPNVSPLMDIEYGIDTVGNVSQILDYVGGQTRTMGYDDLDRLTSASGPWGSTTYEYDPIDNLHRRSTPSVGDDVTFPMNGGRLWRVYDVHNQSNRFTYGHDVRGNRTSRSVPGGDTTVYRFDAANRMLGIEGPPPANSADPIPLVPAYYYDAHGRRAGEIHADDAKWIFYTKDSKLRYTTDHNRQQISQVYLGGLRVASYTDYPQELQQPSVTTWHHNDQLGSTVINSNANGLGGSLIAYDPWGKISNGQIVDGPGFTGHVMDPESGLIYMQQRYYDPDVGRFLSVDPVGTDVATGGNFNRYWYAYNNPYKFTDPDGRCPNCVTGGIGAGVGLLVGLGVEGYKQFKSGKYDGRSLLIEGGKGAVVGGLIGLTGGAASGLGATSSVALTSGVGLGVGSGANAVGELAKGNAVPSATENLTAGAYTAIGAGVGQAAGKLLDEALSVAVPAVASHPVTSLSGKTFNTAIQPATVLRHTEEATALGNAAGAATEGSVKPRLPERIDN